jgi:hypothetical protein
MKDDLGLIKAMIDTLKQDIKEDLFVIKTLLILAVTLLVLKLGSLFL